MVQRTSIDYGLGRIVTTEYDEQIADHGSFLVIVQLHDMLVREFVEGHLHHRHGTLNNLLTGRND